jgi:hypothetical protein
VRASDLLGLPVVGPEGEPLGHVVDLRLVQDGPLLGGLAALRIDGVVVGRHSVTARLGYDRTDARGPWLLRVLARWVTRHNGYLPWEDAHLAEGRLVAGSPRLPDVPVLRGP